jgi:hypothetical protein
MPHIVRRPSGMRHVSLLRSALLASLLVSANNLPAQAPDQAAKSNPVPVINADLGSCSAEFTVRDDSSKPVPDAKIRVHIAYGFMSLHKLDLEVGTNADGKARFEGLPEKVKRPLEFHASQGKLEGSAVLDPAKECKSQHSIVLTETPQTP